MVVCLAHPEDGGWEVVVVGGVPVVLGHKTDSAPPRIVSTVLAWSSAYVFQNVSFS